MQNKPTQIFLFRQQSRDFLRSGMFIYLSIDSRQRNFLCDLVSGAI